MSISARRPPPLPNSSRSSLPTLTIRYGGISHRFLFPTHVAPEIASQLLHQQITCAWEIPQDAVLSLCMVDDPSLPPIRIPLHISCIDPSHPVYDLIIEFINHDASTIWKRQHGSGAPQPQGQQIQQTQQTQHQHQYQPPPPPIQQQQQQQQQQPQQQQQQLQTRNTNTCTNTNATRPQSSSISSSAPAVTSTPTASTSSSSSTSSSTSTSTSTSPSTPSSNIVKALWDYQARGSTEISFSAGDRIQVLSQYDREWYKGIVLPPAGAPAPTTPPLPGFFPANFVAGLELLDKSILASDDSSDVKYQDTEYFESYSTLIIHHQMLSDDLRTRAYKDAVIKLKPHIEGKIVLDVGCGSGILTLFCAMFGGAKHVYGVDASDIIPMAASKVVAENNMKSRVTLITGKIESITLPVPKVDIIISEWMGTFLVCESMIESILTARKMFLKEDGIMMPSAARLYLAPLGADAFWAKRVTYWNDVYGVKMSSLIPTAKKHFFEKPVYQHKVKPEELIGAAVPVWELDMQTMEESELETHANDFKMMMTRDGTLHGFVSWFDVDFAAPNDAEPLILSTSPDFIPTHWKQVMFVLQEPLIVKKDQLVTGTFTVKRNQIWRRHFEAQIVFHTDDHSTETTATGTIDPDTSRIYHASRRNGRITIRQRFDMWR